ncbi:hypothetical protein AMATHDRAFT_60976 [Amanita thiersii Skay4041]|uniref:Uncharacterized protein n=1 Tax=Amanita thiersii Skay4041 TaxID=703135 RepID=A0A2A9NK40_9AGAR|nr:hypothetical protein AMATHDRAFT_60976 [Amanita thiersii Skay4041]
MEKVGNSDICACLTNLRPERTKTLNRYTPKQVPDWLASSNTHIMYHPIRLYETPCRGEEIRSRMSFTDTRSSPGIPTYADLLIAVQRQYKWCLGPTLTFISYACQLSSLVVFVV